MGTDLFSIEINKSVPNLLKGKPIGSYDLQIAAIALANDCVLVTHNTGEFSRIAGLKMEDWEVV